MVNKVNLYIYDISKGMARQLSFPLLGKQIDGVWHTAIVCYGKEYYYGSEGITSTLPSTTILGPPDETVCLGETCVAKNVFREYLSGLSSRAFRPDKYHLFNHNCNTFSNEVAQFLTGKRIPSYITDLPQEVMSTPFGAMIAQFFQNAQFHPQDDNTPMIDDEVDSSFDGPELIYPEGFHDRSHSSSMDSNSDNQENALLPATFIVADDELTDSITHLKATFKEWSKHLDKLKCILEEVEFDFGDEDVVCKDVTESLGCLCTELQGNGNGNVKSFKSLLVVLKATALNLSKIFKYAEGDEIILNVINKLQRGNFNEIKLLRIQFLTNLLSVYELRNHILGIESMLRTLVTLTVSSILDGPGAQIREAGCCLSYSLSIVKINDDHAFELSSALLHVISDMGRDSTSRNYCIAALKNFVRRSDQIAELAKMIVPEICETELNI